MFTTYILYSKNADKFYVGMTQNINQRIQKHNNKNKGYTNQTNDWCLVFSKQFETKKEALDFEKQIKNWKSRAMIKKLIQSEGFEHPDA